MPPAGVQGGQPHADRRLTDDLLVLRGGLAGTAAGAGVHELQRRVAGGHHDPHRAVGVLPGRDRPAVDGAVVGDLGRGRVRQVDGDQVRVGDRRPEGQEGAVADDAAPPVHRPRLVAHHEHVAVAQQQLGLDQHRTGQRDARELAGPVAGDVGDHELAAGDAHHQGAVGLGDVALVDVGLLGVGAGAAAPDRRRPGPPRRPRRAGCRPTAPRTSGAPVRRRSRRGRPAAGPGRRTTGAAARSPRTRAAARPRRTAPAAARRPPRPGPSRRAAPRW